MSNILIIIKSFLIRNFMAQILFGDSEFELPIVQGTCGPPAVDVQKLYGNSGYFTYDPGFMSTASCSSAITYIDGKQGILRYRGYNATDLAKKYDFLSVSYLLIYGELPSSLEYENFTKKIKASSDLLTENVIRSFANNSHPMSILIGCLASLAAQYEDRNDIDYVIMAIAQITVIVAAIYKHINNLPITRSNINMKYVENFLNMMFGSNKEAKDIIVKSLNTIFILHADHEQNASTATLRLTASSGANPFACMAAASATLWGPAHGGANEAAIKMLQRIGSKKNISTFIQKVKSKEEKLMGFGHRVYKNYDPRALMLREICHTVLETCQDKKSEMLEVAIELENIALKDDYFIERELYPNLDFYSGIILQAIGVPTNMFINFFALARTSGWVAQLKEVKSDAKQKIGRPRQIYIGKDFREL